MVITRLRIVRAHNSAHIKMSACKLDILTTSTTETDGNIPFHICLFNLHFAIVSGFLGSSGCSPLTTEVVTGYWNKNNLFMYCLAHKDGRSWQKIRSLVSARHSVSRGPPMKEDTPRDIARMTSDVLVIIRFDHTVFLATIDLCQYH